MKRVLIFGAGFSGTAIGRSMAADGVAVAGTSRSEARFATLQAHGIRPLIFDGAITPELADWLAETSHLIISIAPNAEGDPVLRALDGRLPSLAPGLEWIGYLSTIGVYGDRGGGWVGEDGSLDATSQRGRWRIAAEAAWSAEGQRLSVPVALIRLAGIYGPGRNAMVNLAAGKAKRVIKPGQVFNRIHVDDIAGATRLLAERRLAGAFNGTDDEPAPPQDVVTFASALMGLEPPAEIAFEDAEMNPMARSFYGDNKRVSNDALKAAGYRFRHPDYRAAFTAMHGDGSWRGSSK